MPDFTLINVEACQSTLTWSRDVKGSKGATYIVRYDAVSHNNPNVQRDYSCTCMSYVFKRPDYCKHIKAVMDERCGYGEESSHNPPMPYNKHLDDGKHCPHCGEDLVYDVVAV
jgi:hypothetical protein